METDGLSPSDTLFFELLTLCRFSFARLARAPEDTPFGKDENVAA